MGILSKYRDFLKRRREKAIAKNAAIITNPKAVREDRVAAIEYLIDLDDPQVAVPALLQRFEFSLEHGINDTREKESVMTGIADFGQPAVPLIIDHLRKTYRIAWPIKTLKKITNDLTIRDALISCLDFSDVSLAQHKVDKNYDILCYLHEYQLPAAAIGAIFSLLQDLDERVRFAAVEVLVEQEGEQDHIAQKLAPFLTDTSPENSRLHQTVVAAFAQRNWPTPDNK